MHKHMNRTHFFALSSLLLLPGCSFNPLSWVKGKDACCSASDKSTALLTINGKVVISEDSLNKEIQSIIEKNPQYEQYMKINENHFRKLVFDEKKSYALAEEWAKRNKVENKPEFKEALDQAKKHMFVGLLQKEVADGIMISDEEAAEFYNKSEYKTHFKSEFADLDAQKKDAVKNMMKQEKFKAALESVFANIEKEAKIVVNEDFFKEKPATEEVAPAAEAAAEHKEAPAHTA